MAAVDVVQERPRSCRHGTRERLSRGRVLAAVHVVQVLGLEFVAAARADARLEVEPLKSLRSFCNKARAPFKTSDCSAASAEAFNGTWLQRLSCRRRACCVLSHGAFVLSLSRVRATQAARNGARARANLLIVAVAARSLSYRRVRLDLASVAEWLDRFAVPFLKRAQRAPDANERGKGARASFYGRRCCSTRFGPRSFFSFEVHVCVCCVVL